MQIKFYLLLATLILFSNLLFAQDFMTINERVEQIRPTQSNTIQPFTLAKEKRSTNGITYLKLDPKVHRSLWEQKSTFVELEIATGENESIVIEAFKIDVLADDMQIIYSDGQVVEGMADEALFYWGNVQNEAENLATISIFADEMIISMNDNVRYQSIAAVDENEFYAFYDERQTIPEQAFDCLENQLPDDPASSIAPTSTRSKSANCPIGVYIEADFESFQNKGNGTANYVMGFFSQTAILYNNQGIPMEISDIKIWNTNDPYSGSTRDQLGQFGGNVRNNFDGDLAHLVTVKGNSGSIAGIAWLDVLCRSYSSNSNFGPYGYSQVFGQFQNVPTYSPTVSLFSHELGHNLGASHTHACKWGPNNNQALDNCRATEGSCAAGPAPANGEGSIMSYCSRKALKFLPEVIQRMRNEYNQANSNCLTCDGGSSNACNGTQSINSNNIGSGTYSADNITSTGRVRNNRNVTFLGGNSITLNAGFQVNAGGRFTARIDPSVCSGLASDEGVNLRSTANDLTEAEVTESVQKITFYPNPAQQSITVNYQIDGTDFIEISIYNLAGQRARTLKTEQNPLVGKYEETYPLTKLPKGIYYLRLVTDSQQWTKKLIVL